MKYLTMFRTPIKHVTKYSDKLFKHLQSVQRQMQTCGHRQLAEYYRSESKAFPFLPILNSDIELTRDLVTCSQELISYSGLIPEAIA